MTGAGGAAGAVGATGATGASGALPFVINVVDSAAISDIVGVEFASLVLTASDLVQPRQVVFEGGFSHQYSTTSSTVVLEVLINGVVFLTATSAFSSASGGTNQHQFRGNIFLGAAGPTSRVLASMVRTLSAAFTTSQNASPNLQVDSSAGLTIKVRFRMLAVVAGTAVRGQVARIGVR